VAHDFLDIRRKVRVERNGVTPFPLAPLGERDALGDGPASRDCGAQHDNRLVVVFHNHFSALPDLFLL
jgi:hypothetical protein